jgi:hypothetical protein
VSIDQGYSWPLEVTFTHDGMEIRHEGQTVHKEGTYVARSTKRPLIEGGVFKGMVDVDNVSSVHNQK